MADFTWRDEWSVGDPILDNDHRTLVALIRVLGTDAAKAEDRVASVVLMRLLQYARDHFEREEVHMERIGHPDLPAHRLLHEAMLSEVAEAAVNRREFASASMGTSVYQHLVRWLTQHIMVHDMAYALNNGTACHTPRQEIA
jgi:hemerythrin